MPMPNWWRYLNKRFFNPRAMKDDKWDLITHVGRISGKVFTTPIDAAPVPGGYVIFLMYGRNTDWAKNVLVAGSATLTKAGAEIELSNPRIVQVADIESELPSGSYRPPKVLRVKELLRMDTASSGSSR